MKLIIKTFFFTSLIAVLVFNAIFVCGAASEKKSPYKHLQRIGTDIMSVSYRGDTAFYPENSLEGINSAHKKGADMVSVNIEKTADGVFILCEDESLNNICETSATNVREIKFSVIEKCFLYDNSGNLTNCRFATAEEVIKKTEKSLFLIFDFNWDDREEIYELIKENDALERVFLRTKQGSKSICSWVSTKQEKPFVIGVYDGGIIFNAISHINNLSETGMPLVQYQSKNYFNVMYGSFVYKNFSSEGKAAAIAPVYQPDLCGQRSDSQSGWDELIDKGFSVIETNNIEAFEDYLKSRKDVLENLEILKNKADAIDKSVYSYVSVENLNSSLSKAEVVLSGAESSLAEMQNVYSQLINSMNSLMVKSGDDTQKGALNVTAGKIIAAVLVTAGILSGEIFIHKMHVKRRKTAK